MPIMLFQLCKVFYRWLVVVTYHPSAALRFGPGGAPRAALAGDLQQVARLLGRATVDATATW